MEQFFQQLLNGLAVGGIYALVALGYTMVYGVLKLINFAHGDLFTIGAYLGLTLLVSGGLAGSLPPVLAVLLVFFMVGLLVALICGAGISGLAFAVASLWLLGGMQLVCLGVVGQYVGKAYAEVKARPRYIVEKFLGD